MTEFVFMKFVVTGGAGFIGSYLVKYLVKCKHEISVIDNLFRGKIQNISEIRNEITFHETDILNYEEIKNIIKDSDGIFHQAALTSVQESYTQKEKYYKVNVEGTENIFKLAKEFGIKTVYASSSSIYGNSKKIPISEDFEKKPINPYGMTKLEDEYLAEKYSKQGAKIIGLRYFNVFGKGQTVDYAGVITKFIERISENKPPVIFGDGSQVRDFISVEDVAKANLMAMESSINQGFFNVGTGVATSINDLANIMIRLSGKNIEPIYEKLPEGDVKTSLADTSLARKLLSWNSETKIEEGLQKFFFN